jgi:hypothetical protein
MTDLDRPAGLAVLVAVAGCFLLACAVPVVVAVFVAELTP